MKKPPRDPALLFSRLESKARKGTVEVEDLLALVPTRSSAHASQMHDIAAAHAWSAEPGGHGRLPPLRVWADAVACALEMGPEGLAAVALDSSREGHVRSIHVQTLEPFHDAQAAAAAIQVGERLRPAPADEEVRVQVVAVLNLILSFPPTVVLEAAVEERGRVLVEQVAVHATTAATRAGALCALRGLGNVGSLALVRQLGSLPAPWSDIPASVVRAIKARAK